MFVTELVKYKPFRDFLLQNFPKPKAIFSKKKNSVNPNPSLTGNSFEILYTLQITKKKDIKRVLEDELQRAVNNIKYLNSNRTFLSGDKQIRYIGLPSDDYKKRVIELKSVLECPFLEKTEKVNSLEIFDNTVLGLWALQQKTKLPVCNFDGHHIMIYDSGSLEKFYQKIISQFELKALKYLQSRALTIHFTKLLLQFTHISSQWFSMCCPFNNLSFESTYLSNTFNHFKHFNSQFLNSSSHALRKPSLKYLDVLATPDFISKNKILELKTSKVFFSTRDYLQALCYLIFAQQSDNIKKYGKLKLISIYYSQFNSAVEINIEDFQYNDIIIKEMKKIIQRYKYEQLHYMI